MIFYNLNNLNILFQLGSFSTAFLYERINILLSCIATMATSGLIMLLVTFIHDIWVMLFLFGVLGFAFGINTTSVNFHIIYLWGKEVTPFMQATGLAFGSG